jgi:hypothetical protein
VVLRLGKGQGDDQRHHHGHQQCHEKGKHVLKIFSGDELHVVFARVQSGMALALPGTMPA